MTNVSLVVHDSKRPIPVSSTATSGSGNKRKPDSCHAEAPPGVRQARTETFLTADPVGGDKDGDSTDQIYYDIPNSTEIMPIESGAPVFLADVPEGEGGDSAGLFAYMPGLADNPEEPAGVVAPQVEAEAEQQWPEDEMAEPPRAPCRIPEEIMNGDLGTIPPFALKDSACRSHVDNVSAGDSTGLGAVLGSPNFSAANDDDGPLAGLVLDLDLDYLNCLDDLDLGVDLDLNHLDNLDLGNDGASAMTPITSQEEKAAAEEELDILTEPTSTLQATEIMAPMSCCGVGEEPQIHGPPPRPVSRASLLRRRPAGLPVRSTEALSDLAVVNILRRWKKNDSELPAFVHQLDLYTNHPWEIVKDLEHALRATSKHGPGEKTCFIGSKKDGNRHERKVNGEGGGTWHAEGAAKSIPGFNACKKRFSYRKRTPGKSGQLQRTGWIMMQFSLDKDKEGAGQNDHMVICMVYKSNHAAEITSTAASSSAGAEEDMASVDDESSFPGGDGSSPVPAEAAPMPPVSIRLASKPSGPRLRPEEAQDGLIGDGSKIITTDQLLLEAAGKAVHCGDFKKACQIPEFVAAKNMYLTTIHQLGLDSSIVSDPFNQLDVHLQHVAMTKELTPNERDHIVCLGKRMSTTIFSEYLNELGKTARQAFNALETLGVNVQEALQRASKMTNVSFVVHDSKAKDSVQFLLSTFLEVGFVSKVDEGVENKRPIPVSSTATSGSGIKRKTDGDHAEAPPGVRQARTETFLTADTVGGDKDGDSTDQISIFSGILNGAEITPIGGGAHVFLADVPEREGGDSAGWFADMPGLADNPEEPACVVAPQVEAEAEAEQQWPEDEMAEPPSAPCRIPEEIMDGDSARRSHVDNVSAGDSTGLGAGAFYYTNLSAANDGVGGPTRLTASGYPNFSAATDGPGGPTGLTAGAFGYPNFSAANVGTGGPAGLAASGSPNFSAANDFSLEDFDFDIDNNEYVAR